MKNIKKTALAAVLAIMLLLSLASCARVDETELDALRTLTQSVVGSVVNDDIPSAYPLFDERYITKERAEEVLPKISEYLGELTAFEIEEMTGYSYKKSKELGYVNATFLVGADNADFYVVIGKMTDSDKICYLDISLKEHMTPTYTGTLTTLRGANALQWIVAVVGVALMVFSFWMLLDCAKSKIKRKVIWLLAVLFGFLSLTFSLAPGESVRLFFGVGNIVTSSAMKVYSTAELQLSLVLPIGALVYFIKRKELKARAQVVRRSAPDNTEEGSKESEQVKEDRP